MNIYSPFPSIESDVDHQRTIEVSLQLHRPGAHLLKRRCCLANSGNGRAHQRQLQRGLRYAIRIFAGTVVLWEIAALLGDFAPIWATVSLVMASEIETLASFLHSMRRFGHMALGCAIALTVIAATRPNLWEFAAAAAVSALISFFVPEIGGNWRAAPAATVIVLGAGFQTFTQHAGLREALVRSSEVVGGCVVALLISALANVVWTEVRR